MKVTKNKKIVGMVFSALLLVGGFVEAQTHEIPAAPADYLSKKNPLEGKKEALERGAKVYEGKCAKCHGAKGDGQGKSATDLNPPVTAFDTAGYLKGRKDGQLYWIIEKGSPDTDMDGYGPGTNFNLNEKDIWSLVAFIRNKFSK